MRKPVKKVQASRRKRSSTPQPATGFKSPATQKTAEPHVGVDLKPVDEPRNGYAHVGKLTKEDIKRMKKTGELSLTCDDETGIELKGEYGRSETPHLVAHGRRRVVLAMMLSGMPCSDIVRTCKSTYLMTPTQTRFFVNEFRRQFREESEEASAYARAEAITRIRRDLAQMRANQSKRKWSDVRGHERFLAMLEGTLTPVRVQVLDANETVRDALVQVLGSMSEDDLEEFVKGEVVTHGEELTAAE